ncbi:hypothetical protein Tco_0607629 [Tanacetum coccineum]
MVLKFTCLQKEDLFKNKLMSLGAKIGVRRIFECWFSDYITNGHQFTMSNRHQELASPDANGFCKELASPKQTAFGKDISNPLRVGSLLKTIWLSVHHVIAMKHWLFLSKRLLGRIVGFLEDFTTYYCWFNNGAASEDLVLLRKIEENRLISLDLSRLAATLNRLERSIQIGIYNVVVMQRFSTTTPEGIDLVL